MTSESRISGRSAVQCDVDFKRRGDARYRVELFDLSQGGCSLSPPTRLDRGDSISLRLDGLEAIPGEIAWTSGWKAGVRFDRPFHIAVFDHVVARVGVSIPA